MLFKRVSLVAVMAAAMFSAGCSTSGSDKPAADAGTPPSLDGRCSADAAQFALGKQASADLLEQARGRAGALVARILGPHDMVTLEYRSERLNLNTDEAGKVNRVSCG